MVSYQVLHEYCDVQPAADHGPEDITAKPVGKISAKSLQNPSDPEAGYSGHKGLGCRKHWYRAAFVAPSCQACPQRARCPVKPGKHYHYLCCDEKAIRLTQRRAH
jgi:hypothetical protein